MSFQKTPDQKEALKLLASDAPYVMLYGGSRSGKTFTLVYALLIRALKEPRSRHAILRFRANSVRQSIRLDTFNRVMKLCFPKLKFNENRTDGYIELANGSEIWFGGLDSDERVEKILGKEFATIYFNECSEISFDAVSIALTRLAQKCALNNKAYFDCNPPGKKHWSYLLFKAKIDPVTRKALGKPQLYASMLMNPAGNSANLPRGYLENTLKNLPERQKSRFLNGEWLDEAEGALWNYALLDHCRVNRMPCEVERMVIGVDPAVTYNKHSDNTGIVIAARGSDGNIYVLGDASMHAPVAKWSKKVAELYDHYNVDRVIGEVNNGGELIESALRMQKFNLSYKAVRASHGKLARAEPVAAMYEKGLIHHVGIFAELEEEMCSFNPSVSNFSPDRLDALVWACSELASDNGDFRAILV